MAYLFSVPHPITFSPFGFEQLDSDRWFDPDTRDVVVLSIGQALPRAPLWLDGIDVLRRELARAHAATGTLLEADVVSLDGSRALYTLVAERLPKSPTGRLFRASFVFAKADRTAVLTGQFEEWDISGMRESLVSIKLGMPGVKQGGHPYDPQLPYEQSDDPAWDAQFPKHPLTKAREWVRNVRESAVVDLGFAALPDFRAG